MNRHYTRSTFYAVQEDVSPEKNMCVLAKHHQSQRYIARPARTLRTSFNGPRWRREYQSVPAHFLHRFRQRLVRGKTSESLDNSSRPLTDLLCDCQNSKNVRVIPHIRSGTYAETLTLTSNRKNNRHHAGPTDRYTYNT